MKKSTSFSCINYDSLCELAWVDHRELKFISYKHFFYIYGVYLCKVFVFAPCIAIALISPWHWLTYFGAKFTYFVVETAAPYPEDTCFSTRAFLASDFTLPFVGSTVEYNEQYLMPMLQVGGASFFEAFRLYLLFLKYESLTIFFTTLAIIYVKARFPKFCKPRLIGLSLQWRKIRLRLLYMLVNNKKLMYIIGNSGKNKVNAMYKLRLRQYKRWCKRFKKKKPVIFYDELPFTLLYGMFVSPAKGGEGLSVPATFRNYSFYGTNLEDSYGPYEACRADSTYSHVEFEDILTVTEVLMGIFENMWESNEASQLTDYLNKKLPYNDFTKVPHHMDVFVPKGLRWGVMDYGGVLFRVENTVLSVLSHSFLWSSVIDEELFTPRMAQSNRAYPCLTPEIIVNNVAFPLLILFSLDAKFLEGNIPILEELGDLILPLLPIMPPESHPYVYLMCILDYDEEEALTVSYVFLFYFCMLMHYAYCYILLKGWSTPPPSYKSLFGRL